MPALTHDCRGAHISARSQPQHKDGGHSMCPGDKIVTNALFSTIVTQVIRVFFYNHLSKKMGSQNIQGIQFIGGFLFS